MSTLFDLRTAIIVILVLALFGFGAGNDLPIHTDSVNALIIEGGLYIGCLYFWRSLFRLPILLVIFYRRSRYAWVVYKMNRRDGLSDGFIRAFLDRRRWNVGALGQIDRLALIVIVILTTQPHIAVIMTDLGGVLGILMLIFIYIYTGRFAFILGEASEGRGNNAGGLPFIDLNE
jgi:hypothetical protein